MIARLDRLPATRSVWRLLAMLSLGGAFEYYDLFLMGYIGPGLVRSGLFTAGSASLFGMSGLAAFVSATFGGLFVGTLVFGFAADRFGRRTVFTWSLLWYTAASLLMAIQTTTGGVVAWRAITGIGIGVELVTIDTYIAELMPRAIRGRAFALNQVVQFTAVPFVAFIAWMLVPRSPFGIEGWRWVVAIGSASAVAVWMIRRAVPESPRWLVTHGRIEEADRVLRDLEARVAAETGVPLAMPQPDTETPVTAPDRSILRIVRPPYLGRTLMLMAFNAAQTIGYYGFSSWVPTLLVAAGVTTTASLGYAFAIALAAPAGPLLMSPVADRMDRKWQIVASALSIAICGLLFAHQSGVWLIVLGVLLTCSNNWMSVAFHAYQSELFPTEVRAGAVGFVYSWSRFSAIFTSLAIGFLLSHAGVSGVFVFIAGAMLVAGSSVALFGPRTAGLSLEDISAR